MPQIDRRCGSRTHFASRCDGVKPRDDLTNILLKLKQFGDLARDTSIDAPANATMCRWQHMRQSKSSEPPPLWNILTRSHFIITILLGSRRGKLERLTSKYISDCVLDVAILDACSAAAESALEGSIFHARVPTHTLPRLLTNSLGNSLPESRCVSRASRQQCRLRATRRSLLTKKIQQGREGAGTCEEVGGW